MGSYPIMSHHGKKIMTEGFLLLDRADKDAEYLRTSKSTEPTLRLTIASAIRSFMQSMMMFRQPSPLHSLGLVVVAAWLVRQVE
jgi:hypothetical protein